MMIYSVLYPSQGYKYCWPNQTKLHQDQAVSRPSYTTHNIPSSKLISHPILNIGASVVVSHFFEDDLLLTCISAASCSLVFSSSDSVKILGLINFSFLRYTAPF
uniref:Uncharacterized protein n=1 Tax=Cacopsylla melanoneura TaxID=428564 RepID=A0A8D8X9A5_9HEMI